MTTYSQLMPYLTPELPGVMDGVLANAIREAAREFCRETGVWWKDLADQAVVADQQDYDLSSIIPENSEIVSIRWVKVNGTTQTPDRFSLYESATLKFGDNYIPTVADSDGLEISVTLMPELEDDALAGWVLTRWYKAILAYTCVSLMSDRTKPYYNPDRLQYWMEEKSKWENAAKRSVMTGHINQDLRAGTDNWLI